MIHFDTTFLVDLQRELALERPGPAFEFMEDLDEREVLRVSVFVVAELRFGADLSRKPEKLHAEIDDLMTGLTVSYPNDAFALRFAREAAAMRRTWGGYQEMDLIIAVAALLDDAPLVTRNVKHFTRVPGLRVLSY